MKNKQTKQAEWLKFLDLVRALGQQYIDMDDPFECYCALAHDVINVIEPTMKGGE